ncbi:MAG TPA: hypothetical protein VHC69_14350 [Polyangiaceae bacterium]|nr:hypothetical protein [Polyangiaceae bacterium]
MSLTGALEKKREATAAPSTITTSFDRIEDARRYVAKMPPAISGQGGHVATFNAARKLADFGLSEDDVFQVLCADYNPRCEPPWSEKELRHKAREAMDREVVHPMEERRSREHHTNGSRSAPTAEGNHGSAEGSNHGGPGPTPDDPLRGLKHLGNVALIGRQAITTLATQAVVYIWQDIAVAGTIIVIAGPPAEGKTTLLFLILGARMNRGEAVTLLGLTAAFDHNAVKAARRPYPWMTWTAPILSLDASAGGDCAFASAFISYGIERVAARRFEATRRSYVDCRSARWRGGNRTPYRKMCCSSSEGEVARTRVKNVLARGSLDERQDQLEPLRVVLVSRHGAGGSGTSGRASPISRNPAEGLAP